MAKIKKNCEVCGDEHEVRQADLNRGWGRTCGKSCAATLSNRETGKYGRYLDAKRKYQEANEGQGFVPLSIEDHDPNKDRY